MVHEIKKHLDEGKVYFGIKECLKNSKNITQIVLVSDYRKEIDSLLRANNLSIRILGMGKREARERLGTKFDCEVFGLKR